MKKVGLLAFAPGILTLAAAVFALVLLLVRWLWAWTVSDLFPGAVNQGLIAPSISWLTAFKLAIVAALIGGFAGGSTVRNEQSREAQKT